MSFCRIIFIGLVISQISCNTEDVSNCVSPSFDEIIIRNEDQFDTTSNVSTRTDVNIYYEKRILPVKGGQYSVYKNRVLKNYSFYQNSTIARYVEDYDQNGILINREGNPILFTKIEEVNKDSFVFNLYISTLSITPIKSFIVLNSKDTIHALPSNAISFSNSVNYRGGIRMSAIGKVDFQTTLIYSNCKGENHTVLDSGYIYH